MGPNVGANSRPVRLRDGVLTVAVADPAWATQLRFLEATLVQRLQASWAPKRSIRIVVRVRPEALRETLRECPGSALSAGRISSS